MDVVKIFEEPRVALIEKEIAFLHERYCGRDEQENVVQYLLNIRHSLLRELNVYDEEMQTMLVSFNNRLQSAAITLYNKVKVLADEYADRYGSSHEYEINGKLFLGFNYPEKHPLQTERAKSVWEALTQGGYYPLYSDGCTWELRVTFQKSDFNAYKDASHWLGLDTDTENWQEGLDRNWSEGMHLVYPFHNLYDHLGFSLYDLIYVEDFNMEVNVNFENNIHYQL